MTFFLCPTSLLQRDWEDTSSKGATYKKREVRRLHEGSAAAVADMLKASSEEGVAAAFQSLGLMSEASRVQVQEALSFLESWCCVIRGPFTREQWQIQAYEGARCKNETLHASTLCGFCDEAAVHGPCEHAYAFALATGELSQNSVDKRGAGRPTKRKAEQEDTSAAAKILLPGSAHNSICDAGAVRPQEVGPRRQLSKDEERLLTALKAAGQASKFAIMREHGLSCDLLQRATWSDLLNLYGIMPREAVTIQDYLRQKTEGKESASGNAENIRFETKDQRAADKTREGVAERDAVNAGNVRRQGESKGYAIKRVNVGTHIPTERWGAEKVSQVGFCGFAVGVVVVVSCRLRFGWLPAPFCVSLRTRCHSQPYR